MKLEGKVAIVTGAGRGLGRSIALCLAEEGAAIAVISLHQETAEQAATEIRSRGGKALALPKGQIPPPVTQISSEHPIPGRIGQPEEGRAIGVHQAAAIRRNTHRPVAVKGTLTVVGLSR